MKNKILLPIITLLISVALLLGLTLGLNGVAQKNAQKKHLEVMQILLPDSKTFTIEEYTGTDTNIKSVHKSETGYIVENVVYGYVDDIRMMVAVDKDGKCVGIMVLEMHETFGLGLKALTNHKFLSQFLGSSKTMEVGETIDAISGATVTSKAITKSVNSAIAYITGADIETGPTEWGS